MKAYLAKEYLVSVRTIEIGGIEMSDAGVDGMVNEFDHLGIGLGRAVEG